MNQFIPTDFPDPVCPAMRRCGIFARSPTMKSPLISLPTAIASLDLCRVNAISSRTSLIPTVSRFSFGTSIPTSPSPGIGAWIRMDFALSASVRSFLRASIFANLTHSDGRSLYWITVGPTHSSSISTSMPNWRNVRCMRSDFSSISSGETTLICCISLSRRRLGKSQVPKSTPFAL